MTLKKLMQRGGLSRIANANPANAANHKAENSGTLARLATLALAKGQRAPNETTDPLPNSVAESHRLQAELVRLVNRVADHHGFTAEQRQEALEIALADPTVALECFRVLAAGIFTPRP